MGSEVFDSQIPHDLRWGRDRVDHLCATSACERYLSDQRERDALAEGQPWPMPHDGWQGTQSSQPDTLGCVGDPDEIIRQHVGDGDAACADVVALVGIGQRDGIRH